MSGDEKSFELPAILDCYLSKHIIILLSHDYTGPALDISAVLTVTEQKSLLKIKDNGVSINQAVKFSI